MTNRFKLTPMESARALLEMAEPPEARTDFEVVSAEALPDGALTRVVVRHRLTHETLVGPVPKGQQVRHLGSCMSRRCVDPQHLFWYGRDPSGYRWPVWRTHIVAWRLTQQSVRKLLERGGRGDGKLESRVTRLMVLEEHAQTIELLKTRINGMLSWETEMKRFPLPEVRANLDVLERMFEQHLKMQQQLGYIPGTRSAAAWDAAGGHGVRRDAEASGR